MGLYRRGFAECLYNSKLSPPVLKGISVSASLWFYKGLMGFRCGNFFVQGPYNRIPSITLECGAGKMNDELYTEPLFAYTGKPRNPINTDDLMTYNPHGAHSQGYQRRNPATRQCILYNIS